MPENRSPEGVTCVQQYQTGHNNCHSEEFERKTEPKGRPSQLCVCVCVCVCVLVCVMSTTTPAFEASKLNSLSLNSLSWRKRQKKNNFSQFTFLNKINKCKKMVDFCNGCEKYKF